MKHRKYIIAFLVCVICFFMAHQIAAGSGKSEKAPPLVKDASVKLVAFYFHGNFRCANCKKIEQYSREAIEKYFADELKTKKLVFTMINTDLSENKHFIEDYQLYTRSLVIVEFKGEKQMRWKNLTKVWNYLNDRDAFYKYVSSEIKGYLENI